MYLKTITRPLIILAVVLIIISPSIASQQTSPFRTLNIKIYDINGVPLDATVNVKGSFTSVTRDVVAGEINLTLTRGVYTIEVLKPGFVSQKKKVDLTEGDASVSFFLKPYSYAVYEAQARKNPLFQDTYVKGLPNYLLALIIVSTVAVVASIKYYGLSPAVLIVLMVFLMFLLTIAYFLSLMHSALYAEGFSGVLVYENGDLRWKDLLSPPFAIAVTDYHTGMKPIKTYSPVDQVTFKIVSESDVIGVHTIKVYATPGVKVSVPGETGLTSVNETQPVLTKKVTMKPGDEEYIAVSFEFPTVGTYNATVEEVYPLQGQLRHKFVKLKFEVLNANKGHVLIITNADKAALMKGENTIGIKDSERIYYKGKITTAIRFFNVPYGEYKIVAVNDSLNAREEYLIKVNSPLNVYTLVLSGEVKSEPFISYVDALMISFTAIASAIVFVIIRDRSRSRG